MMRKKIEKNKIMKVAFFIDDITKDGGTERCTAVLSNLLAGRGFDVSILSINASKKRSKYEIDSNVNVKTFNLQKIENAVSRRMKTFKYLGHEIMGGYDVIVVVDTYKSLCFVPFVPLLKTTKTKLISWEHFNQNFGGKHSPRWWGGKAAAQISDALVVLSKADYAAWKNDMKQHPERLKQIYNFPCFDLEKPEFSADCKTVLAVGRLENQKGFDYLLDIWKIIENDKELTGWKLQIVGSGSLEQKLHDKEKSLGLNRVHWLPFTEHIEENYKTASIYVMSSRFEGFALVLLEAKAFGLPIISFDIKNGPNEIIQNGVNGYLIPPFDVNLFAEKLKVLMKDECNRELFTKNSQCNLGRFSRDEITTQWIRLFEGLQGNTK